MTRVIVAKITTYIFQAAFLLLAGYGLWRDASDQSGWLGLFGFGLSFMPVILRRWRGVTLPPSYCFAYLGYILLSLVLGEEFYLYNRLWWWDDMLHMLSGVAIGYVALLLLSIRNIRLNVRSPRWFSLLFMGSVVLASAALWEMFEFAVDQLAGGHMQYGVTDTMMDMINSSIGGLLLTAIVYRQLGRGHGPTRLFRIFYRDNPQFETVKGGV